MKSSDSSPSVEGERTWHNEDL